MPLSEHEKRLLAEMEEALAADDPRLISTFSGKSPDRSRVVAGFAAFILGIVLLFAGLISKFPPLGVAGFAVSLAGLVIALSNLGSLASASSAPKAKKAWSSKFEERWDKRNLE